MNILPDLAIADILALPEPLCRFLKWIILNRAATCEAAAKYLGCTGDEAAALLEELDALGLIERLPVCGEPRYRVRLRGRPLRAPFELLENATGIHGEAPLSLFHVRRSLHGLNCP